MKKKVLVITTIIVVIIVVAVTGICIFNKKNKFYLNDKYYANPIAIENDLDDVEKLIKNKESFLLFIYQPLCTTSYGLSQILNKYSREKGITYYTIAYSKIKDSDTFNYIKYYPSFVIFHKGKMVDFLDAESDEDTEKFKDEKVFSEWLESYVKIKNDNYVPTQRAEENTVTQKIDYDFTLSDVVREDNKVNIYMFWREGCPFCAKEKAFFEEIKDEYSDKYNLYLYEVSNSSNNKKALLAIADTMDKEIEGVPFTVIGNEVFQGFDETIGEQIKSAILNNYQNSYDVYLDTILKDK